MRNKKIFFGLMLGVILGFGVIAGYAFFRYSTQEVSESGSQPALRAAPQFYLPDAQGSLHSLWDFKGKWVVIHFWATWCPPCLVEISDWIELRKSLSQDAPIQFIAISLDARWEDAHRVLPSDRNIHGLTSLLDLSAKTPELFGTFNFPETYLLNPDLKIVTKWVGPQKWNAPETLEFFKKLIAQEESARSP